MRTYSDVVKRRTDENRIDTVETHVCVGACRSPRCGEKPSTRGQTDVPVHAVRQRRTLVGLSIAHRTRARPSRRVPCRIRCACGWRHFPKRRSPGRGTLFGVRLRRRVWQRGLDSPAGPAPFVLTANWHVQRKLIHLLRHLLRNRRWASTFGELAQQPDGVMLRPRQTLRPRRWHHPPIRGLNRLLA